MNLPEYEAMYRVEDTHWWYVGMRRISEAVLEGRTQPGIRILDAGCGTGGNLKWLSRYGPSWGVDISEEALRLCRRRGLSTVTRASVMGLPFPDQAFDLVTSFDVIYHLGVADDVAALREMRRVLRPGGAALVRVPALERLRAEHDAAVHTRQRYSLTELVDRVLDARLDVVRASYANTLLFPLAAALRLAGRGASQHGTGRDHRSDVRPVPSPLNSLLTAVMELEATLIGRTSLPIGLSAMVLAERPHDEDC